MRRTKRVAGLAIAALVALLFGALVLARVENVRFEPVLSGSMRPGIQPGSLAILEPVRVDHLRVGEVVSYLPPGHQIPVMHRIVSLNAQGIVTKGDANPVPDPWGRVAAPAGSSVERLVAVLPKVGWVATIRTQIMAVTGVLLLLLCLGMVWRRPEAHRASAE